MEERGICNTCISDRKCAMRLNLPVWQCEEYSFGNIKPGKAKKPKLKKRKKV
ncbi:MAG: hypothetical protein JW734_03925 [Candidatus Omnitrophica bacterium]|nr:hypothetical protein [Candidatus Omnitrophota bacterium]